MNETYLGGASIVDTSRATGVSKWNVEKIVRQDGIARDLEQQYATGITPGGKMIGRPAKPFGEGDEAKILDLYHGGKSAKAIAKNMGFDHHRMTDFIRKATGSEVLKKGCYGSGGYHGIGVDRSAETEGYMTCADCLTLKPVSEFVRSVNAAYGGHMVYCKPCWYEKSTRKAQLKKYYGMTPELYSSMLDAQGGLCAICHKACKSGHRMSVDHCHATGRIRGLLCKNCNNAIGLMCDDIDILKAAILYLSS